MSAASGADNGDINHSRYFVRKFIPILATAVRARWLNVLTTCMAATGCRPPVNFLADKATHQWETR